MPKRSYPSIQYQAKVNVITLAQARANFRFTALATIFFFFSFWGNSMWRALIAG